MPMDWLEPAINERVKRVISESEERNKTDYESFANILCRLKRRLDNSQHELLNELENLYIDKSLLLEDCYRSGFEDGLNLVKLVFKSDH